MRGNYKIFKTKEKTELKKNNKTNFLLKLVYIYKYKISNN